jgi:release factor glutamine methyltransferase
MAANRITGQPLQYLTGLAGFRRLDLHVGPGVFIPRPETELVAELAMKRLVEGGRLLDLGTGSGAIALAVADERPDATIYATEISHDALIYARKNRDDLGLQVELYESDLFDALPEELLAGLDVIVSNPPYVAWSYRHRLPPEVVEHEPPEALFAPGEGRTVIGSIVRGAVRWLRPGGWLVLEIAEDQGPDVFELLEETGYSDVAIRKDLNDRDRIAEGRHS